MNQLKNDSVSNLIHQTLNRQQQPNQITQNRSTPPNTTIENQGQGTYDIDKFRKLKNKYLSPSFDDELIEVFPFLPGSYQMSNTPNHGGMSEILSPGGM